MKDRIAKMYEKLTNKERAALSFRFLTDMNELEFKRVEDTVPFKTYSCQDIGYQHYLEGFLYMAALWSSEHWKLRTQAMTALCGMHVMLNNDKQDKAKSMIEAHEIWESRLLALDGALLSVCDEHGIDPETVRRLSETKAFVAMSANLMPDAEFQADAQANFTQLLTYRC